MVIVTSEYDFSDCVDPEAAAKQFVEKVTSLVVTLDAGEEAEIWAVCDDEPGKVVTGVHEEDISFELSSLVGDYLCDAEREVRSNTGG